MASQRITGVSCKNSDVMVKIEYQNKPSAALMKKINNRDPHTRPLGSQGELYRLTGGWDGDREALGITMCTLSYKDKCAKILREMRRNKPRWRPKTSFL